MPIVKSHIVQELIHKRTVAEFFSQTSSYWSSMYEQGTGDGDRFSCAAMGRRKAAVIEMVDKYARGRQLQVLDVGCGPGVVLKEMALRGHRIMGIDISEEMVRKANESLGSTTSDHSVCQLGDIESLPFGDETVDVILCLGVLPYLRSEANGVSEMERVLKRGGLAVIVMPNLIKLGSFFDPYYLCRCWHYLCYHILGRVYSGGKVLEPAEFGANRAFGIKRYTLGQVKRLFRGTRLLWSEIVSVEYGPLTFWKKAVLPDSTSIRVSCELEGMSRCHGLSLLSRFANQWVISLIKR